MHGKKISVIMGIYNSSSTLRYAIDSIIAQTYTNWQLILCDDASTDNTYEIAKSYQEKYPEKIILIKNEVNSKLAFSLNHCLKYADGEYIARMDDDDISSPDRFEKQVAFLKENPDVDLVGTYMQRFDGDNKADIVKVPLKPDKFTLKNAVPFNHATIMTYKMVYDTLGGYTVAARTERAEDYDLWFRFFFNGFCGENLAEPLYMVRENIDAISRRTAKSRWKAFKVAQKGFKMLGYPKRYIVRLALGTVLKSIVPFGFIKVYRWFQKKINK